MQKVQVSPSSVEISAPGVTTRYVTPIGAHYTNQVCTQQAIEVTDMFLFKVIYNEDYKFYFWEGLDEDGNPQYINPNFYDQHALIPTNFTKFENTILKLSPGNVQHPFFRTNSRVSRLTKKG